MKKNVDFALIYFARSQNIRSKCEWTRIWTIKNVDEMTLRPLSAPFDDTFYGKLFLKVWQKLSAMTLIMYFCPLLFFMYLTSCFTLCRIQKSSHLQKSIKSYEENKYLHSILWGWHDCLAKTQFSLNRTVLGKGGVQSKTNVIFLGVESYKYLRYPYSLPARWYKIKVA